MKYALFSVMWKSGLVRRGRNVADKEREECSEPDIKSIGALNV